MILTNKNIVEYFTLQICTGTKNEMITDGGEYGFIERIINESLIYKNRIQWYTSLVGLKKSIRPLVNQLKSFGVSSSTNISPFIYIYLHFY